MVLKLDNEKLVNDIVNCMSNSNHVVNNIEYIYHLTILKDYNKFFHKYFPIYAHITLVSANFRQSHMDIMEQQHIQLFHHEWHNSRSQTL